MFDQIKEELSSKIKSTFESFVEDLNSIRTGKPHPAILESVSVSVYGGHMKLKQIATVTVASNKALSVKVWDNGNISEVNKAILSSGLGLHPRVEGNVLMIALPELTEERRLDLKRASSKYTESAKVAVRNLRRNILNKIKANQKSGEFSEDEMHRISKEVQNVTDQAELDIDNQLKSKQKEIEEF